MKSIELTKRLAMIADMVPKHSKVSDIGCDHAYTSIYLVQNKHADKVIAMDVRRGPLEAAKANVTSYGLNNQIDIRLSDGTKALVPGEVDTLLISGMGGELIISILNQGSKVVKECKNLVLSPQSNIHMVRKYLATIGFDIAKEDMCIDENKYYVSMLAVRSDDSLQNAGDDNDICEYDIFDYYGRYLLENKNEVLKEYLGYKLKQFEEVLDNMSQAPDNEKNQQRVAEVRYHIENIRKGYEYYGM